MSDSPPLWGRMFARFQGEVPATTLEAYRRASLPVFELLDQEEARRLAGATEGLSPWTLPPATRTAFLCAWNAFVLQALGNDILDADYEEYPATAGFVPPLTAEQVLDWFTGVEAWLDRAQQAHASPDYRLDVVVPAQLPSWRDTHPCPPTHLRGMLRALHSVGEHAAAAMTVLEAAPPDGPRQQSQLNHIRQLYASARSKARYAAELHGADAPPDVRVRVERHVREAIERFFTLGQLIADPTLADPASPAPAVAPPLPASPRPAADRVAVRAETGGSGSWGPTLRDHPEFDIWCLTAPGAREALQVDPQAEAALKRLWAADPDPERTVALQAEIRAACRRGEVEHASDAHGTLGHFHRCPWGPVYVVQRRVSLNGQMLLKGERFVLALDPGTEGNEFRRRLLLGSFPAEAQAKPRNITSLPADTLPGHPGFDIWCLTDPKARRTLETRESKVKELQDAWATNPDPAHTLELHRTIQAALERGDVERGLNINGREFHWHNCPWGPVYVATTDGVCIGGVRIPRNQRFVLQATHKKIRVHTHIVCKLIDS